MMVEDGLYKGADEAILICLKKELIGYKLKLLDEVMKMRMDVEMKNSYAQLILEDIKVIIEIDDIDRIKRYFG